MEITINSTKRLQIVVSCKQAKTAIKTEPKYKFFPYIPPQHFGFYEVFLKISQLYTNIKATYKPQRTAECRLSNLTSARYIANLECYTALSSKTRLRGADMQRGIYRKLTYEDRFLRKYCCCKKYIWSYMKRENRRKARRILKQINE